MAEGALRTLEVIEGAFDEIGYKAFTKVLNSKDSGVPQNRERNLIVDHREHSTVATTRIKGAVNGEDIRKMAPREWARLQGFPDDYRFELADTHLYKQLGNSVTVPVIEAIAARAREVLDAGKVKGCYDALQREGRRG